MAIFMKFGELKGNGTHTSYPKWIVLESYSWSYSVDVKTTVGAGGSRLAAGKITPSDLSVTKYMDDATGGIMKLVLNGQPTKEVKVVVTPESGGANAVAYLEYDLSQVIISGNTISNSHEGRPLEHITLNFSKIHIRSSPTTDDGKPVPSVGGYDFATARPV